jgi:hypothetical protein
MIDKNSSTEPKKRVYLAHGLYAQDVLLPWDDRQEFAKLHDGLLQEWFPKGTSEEECVLDLAMIYWQKRTLSRLRTAAVLRDPFTSEIVATGKMSWRGIRNGLRKKAREEHGLLQELEATAANGVSRMARAARELAKDPTAQEVEKLMPVLQQGIEVFRKAVIPLLDEARQLPNAEVALDSNYAPDALEKVVRLETALDVRLAKVMARLVALKEFKRTPAGNPSGNSR